MNFNLKILLNSIILILVIPLAGHCINHLGIDNLGIDNLGIDNLGIDKLNFQRAWPLDEKTSIENSWSKTRHSVGISILPNGYTLRRRPVRETTDIGTANQSYDSKIQALLRFSV